MSSADEISLSMWGMSDSTVRFAVYFSLLNMLFFTPTDALNRKFSVKTKNNGSRKFRNLFCIKIKLQRNITDDRRQIGKCVNTEKNKTLRVLESNI